MCFDKTGTLTEDGLDLYGVRPVGYSSKRKELHFEDIVMNIPDLAKLSSNSPEHFTEISK
jgi:cation-transporting ATPase 13A3/4/5